MKYKFSSDINKDEYLEFLSKQKSYYFTQLPEWAEVKDNWGHTVCGLYNEAKELTAATLMLIRSLPMGRKLIYCPRGYVIDYSDREMLDAFTVGVKNYAKKIGAIAVKIDPFVINENYDNATPLADFGTNFKTTVINLKAAGYLHRGFGKELDDYFQPRFNTAIPLFNADGICDAKAVLKSFSKGTRSYIGNYHQKRGVFIETAKPGDDISEFLRLLSSTEERQGIQLRNAEYFNKILNGFGDRAVIYYAKLDLDVYASFLQAAIDKEQNVEKNTATLEEVKSVREERGRVITLATGLNIYPRQHDGVMIAEYLYAGTDLSAFSSLRAANGLIYQSVCDSIGRGCMYYNLGGIDGNLESSLAGFKMKFNPQIFEFVGEFDLVINKTFYFGFDKLLPLAKKAVKKVSRKK